MALDQFTLSAIPRTWILRNEFVQTDDDGLVIDDDWFDDFDQSILLIQEIRQGLEQEDYPLENSLFFRYMNPDPTSSNILIEMDTGKIISIQIRIDLCVEYEQFVSFLISFAKKFDLVFYDFESRCFVSGDLESLNSALTNSSAMKFVTNPKEFLETYGQKVSCYCDGITDRDRRTKGILPGYCGICEVCGAQGHTQHDPSGAPYTGTWCDECLPQIRKSGYFRQFIAIVIFSILFLLLRLGMEFLSNRL